MALNAQSKRPTDAAATKPTNTNHGNELSVADQVAIEAAIAAHGLCTRPGADSDAWYPPSVETPRTEARLERARTRADGQCRGSKKPCPVRDACLSLALAREERHGIWGGLIPHDRKAIAKTGSVEDSAADSGDEPEQNSIDSANEAGKAHVPTSGQGPDREGRAA